jgi:hypothetical protein
MSHNLTYDQIDAANELYARHLGYWRFDTEAFQQLTPLTFQSEAFCLITVVTIDSLYSTGLRYVPGRCESIAKYLFKDRAAIASASKTVNPTYVDKIAGDFVRRKPLSFFSKFFHFVVSDNYPIWDTLARDALKVEHHYPLSKIENYSTFCEVIKELCDSVSGENQIVSAKQLDRYLWLIGKYIDWIPSGKQSNEVINLFNDPTEEQRKLLNTLTNNDYEETISSGVSRRKRAKA